MEHQKLKIVFFSSAAIGIQFLEELYHDDRFKIVWIVTQPDQPSGRGMEVKPNIIKDRYLRSSDCHAPATSSDSKQKLAMTIVTPNTLRLDSKKYPWEWEAFQGWLQNLHPDYIVVIAYWKIIPQYILDIPSIAPINIHGSLLPKYRWASPIQTCLLNGENESWITIMKMSAGLDEWDIIKQLPIPLDIDTTTKDLINTFWIIWPEFTNQTLYDFSIGTVTATAQNHSLATFTSKIGKEDWLVDIYNAPIEQILRMYNAYYLRPKIYFMHNEKRVIIEQLDVDQNIYSKSKYSTIIDSDYIIHPCIRRLLVKPEGKKSMSREEFKKWYIKN